MFDLSAPMPSLYVVIMIAIIFAAIAIGIFFVALRTKKLKEKS
jgi:nitrogen fixation-related uncharacterized protein